MATIICSSSVPIAVARNDSIDFDQCSDRALHDGSFEATGSDSETKKARVVVSIVDGRDYLFVQVGLVLGSRIIDSNGLGCVIAIGYLLEVF